MNYATVCSGIGAPEVAWKDLWGPPAFVSETEPFPSAVLAHHYPDVPNYGDMTKYKEWPDHELELICGGTPCQSFSVAGLRKGMDDPRGNLTLVYLGILARYNPRWFIWENVPGVFSSRSNGGSDFGRFLSALAELGYSCAYRVLDAQYFGVPQRRRRVFVVGHLGADWRPPYAVLFEPESLCGNPPKGGKAGEEVARSLRGQPQSSHREDSDNFVIARALTSSPSMGRSPNEDANLIVMAHGQGNAEICRDGDPSLTCNHEAPIVCEPMTAHTLRGEGFDASEDGTGRGTPIVAFQPKASVSQSMNPSETCPTIGTTKEPAVLTLAIRGRQDGSTLECRDDGKANAILTPNGGRGGIGVGAIASDTIVRRLTPMECERLQGFPDGYTRIPWKNKPVDLCPDGPRYKALGNSMAVPVIWWIGKRIQLWESLVKSGKIKA